MITYCTFFTVHLAQEQKETANILLSVVSTLGLMFVFCFCAMFLFDMLIFKFFIPPLLEYFFDTSSILLYNTIS